MSTRRFPAAVAVSIAVHAALLAWVLSLASPVPAPPVMEVTLLDHFPTPAATPPSSHPPPRAAGSTTATAPTTAPSPHIEPVASGGGAPAATATPTPFTAEGGSGDGRTPDRRGSIAATTGIDGMLQDHFRRQQEAFGENPGDGGPHDQRMLKPGATVTDQLDGIPDLGSGQPGDPRIPGAGPVDIQKVLARDATVVASRERVDRGVMHPFVLDMKHRMEDEWDPTPDDLSAVSHPEMIPDPVCAKRYHLRFKVARVLAVYDAAGERLRIQIVGAPLERHLRDRISRAVDDAGMSPPPPELLDGEGHMRVAWNVFLDSYQGCNLVGTDGSGRKAYGLNFTRGIIELDGMY